MSCGFSIWLYVLNSSILFPPSHRIRVFPVFWIFSFIFIIYWGSRAFWMCMCWWIGWLVGIFISAGFISRDISSVVSFLFWYSQRANPPRFVPISIISW